MAQTDISPKHIFYLLHLKLFLFVFAHRGLWWSKWKEWRNMEVSMPQINQQVIVTRILQKKPIHLPNIDTVRSVLIRGPVRIRTERRGCRKDLSAQQAGSCFFLPCLHWLGCWQILPARTASKSSAPGSRYWYILCGPHCTGIWPP